MTIDVHENAVAQAAGWAEARSRCAVAHATPGVLRLAGSDTVDFLQRITTNDFSGFREPLSTLLVTEKGKIVDIVTAVPEGDHIFLVTSDRRASQVMEWLHRFIIMENVEVTDVTRSCVCYSVIGPQAEQQVAKVAASSGADKLIAVFRNPLSQLPWYTVISERGVRFESVISIESTEIIRIEEGVPSVAIDCDERSHPLELGLESLVSFTKGCYIGQEVIARLDTYKKTSRRFTGLLLGRREGEPLQPGELYSGMEVVGFTTSHTWSPLMNQEIALGYIKSHVEGPAPDFRSKGSGVTRKATVVPLPFRPHGG